MNVLIGGMWTPISEVTGEQLLEAILPSSTGQEGKFIRRNLAGDGFEFADAGGSFAGDMDDIPNGTDYVKTENNLTDAHVVKLSNLSGTNSGDQDLSAYFNKSVDDSDDLTEGATKLLLTSWERTKLGNTSGTNTGDETGAGIRTKLGTTTVGANINTLTNPSAVRWLRVNADNSVTPRTAAETLSDIGAQAAGTYATGSGTASGTNTGDQTSIVGISGTKAQFDSACSDGNFLYVGDVTQYTAPDIPITKKVISSSQTITAAYSAICSGTMEVASGVVLEIGNGAILELT